MGTRGYRVIRFRGRYYRFYNHYDSYPEGLGKKIVAEIPTDPAAYQRWLAARRKEALEWHDALQRFLCRERAEYETDDDLDESTTEPDATEPDATEPDAIEPDAVESDATEPNVTEPNAAQPNVAEPDDAEPDATEPDATKSDAYDSTTDDEHPWGVATDSLPNFTPAFNDLWIEWVYTIDLDNEVFSIDNGAHLHLNRIPRPDWIYAHAYACYGDRVLLPSCVPEEAIADLVVKLPSTIASVLELLENLDVTIVKAKGLDAFPPTQRHGPVLRAKIFNFFQNTYDPMLSAALLSWRADEFPFREIAYAILCLASSSLNLCFVPLKHVSQDRIGYADLKNPNDEGEKAEFLAHLGVGCHLEGLPPGSSPDSEMYWLDGALVHLVVQLIHCPEAVSVAIACVVEHCRSHRPTQCVNAILMSIEHIILMKIYPGGQLERTEPLPLFDIPIHTSMRASKRYEDDELEELCQKRNGNKQTCWPAIADEWLGPEDADETQTTFMALTNFLEVSARQRIPPARHTGSVFPNEIYGIILLYLDLQTHHACMQVSRSFRDLCQRNSMMMDGVVLQAPDTSKTCTTSSALFQQLRAKKLPTGLSRDVTLTCSTYSRSGQRKSSRWHAVLGSERNRRSILPGLTVDLDRIKE